MSESPSWENLNMAQLQPFTHAELMIEHEEAAPPLSRKEELEQKAWEDLSPDEQTELFDESFGLFLDEVRQRARNSEFFILSRDMSDRLIPRTMSFELWIQTARSYLNDKELSTELQFDDICLKEGAEQLYAYSSRFMSHSWAMSLFLTKESDEFNCFIHTVRYESQNYPRPMIDEALMHAPFHLSRETIAACYKRAKNSKLYQDIHSCTASNDDRYYYSSDYLSHAQAQALAEFYSVEQVRNV